MVKNPPANAEDMVQSLVQKEPTCWEATKPMSPTTEPECHSY